MARNVDIPHIVWPLRLDSTGRLQVHDQDSLEEVRQNVQILLRTPLGARPLAPDVGIPDPTFTRGIDAYDLTTRLTDEDTGEPRAIVDIQTNPIDGSGRQQTQITVTLAADEDDPTEL